MSVVVHVHTGSSIIPGLIGGAVVLLGVILTDQFARLRERQKALEDAVWKMNSVSQLLLSGAARFSYSELADRYSEFMHQVGRIRAYARWPIRDAAAIRDEVDATLVRFTVAVDLWNAGIKGQPRLGPIIGTKLVRLVFPPKGLPLDEKINKALEKEGRPTLEERLDSDDLNMPKATEPESSTGQM